MSSSNLFASTLRRPRRLTLLRASALAALLVAATGCSARATRAASADAGSRDGLRVGPPTGAVMPVGGGAQGPEVFRKFIELAGGPDALIVEVPTASGDSVDLSRVGRGLRAAGARNVVVYHTTSRALADADSFVARIANARGVWFGGGRHYRLVNAYAGTKSERAFRAVLERGGVVGGSSAGASILGGYLVRGAPSNNNRIMNHPQYLVGFDYLRNTAVDQHVVARGRLPDLHDSVTSRRPDLLGISVDEGTAWVVRGDTGEVIGRNKAFVYNGRDANDPGRPFLTLHPGDRYDLGARRLLSRAIDGTPLTRGFVDDLFAAHRDPARGGATVLVALDGRVLVNAAYGIPLQPRFTPETGSPNFALGGLGAVLDAVLDRDSAGKLDAASVRRVATTGGMQRVTYDASAQAWRGNVDDLYRFSLMWEGRRPPGVGDAVYGTPEGRQAAWVRDPSRRLTVIILTSDAAFDARGAATRIVEKLGAAR